MRMTYRCKSCTAKLQCDYCGAGTHKRRKSRPPQLIPAKMYGALVVLVTVAFTLLVTGGQS